MPDFNRIKTALYCGKPDRVPLAEGWIDSQIKARLLGEKLDPAQKGTPQEAEYNVRFWCMAGYDYIHVHEDTKQLFAMQREQMGPRNWIDTREASIKSLKDIETYPWPDAEEYDFSLLCETSKKLPDGMKIISGTAGIFETVWMLLGFERFPLAFIDEPELIELMFEKVGSVVYRVFERILEFDNIGALWYCDDIACKSGPMVSPRYIREYLFGWMRKMGELAGKNNLPLLYHSDGNIRPLLDDLVDVGFYAIQPLEQNAMDLDEIKTTYGKDLCLVGGIGVDFPLATGRPEDVRDDVKKMIDRLGRQGGYCVGASNSVPEYVPFANYKAMLDAVFEYGVL